MAGFSFVAARSAKPTEYYLIKVGGRLSNFCWTVKKMERAIKEIIWLIDGVLFLLQKTFTVSLGRLGAGSKSHLDNFFCNFYQLSADILEV